MKNRVRTLLFLLLILALLTAGCTRNTGSLPEGPDTPAPGPVVTIPAPQTAVTAVPARDLASIRSEGLRTDPGGGTIYEFTGNVLVHEGTYASVQVILRYPDGTEYAYDAGGMGGSNVTIKPFFLYPDPRFQPVSPEYLIGLDGIRYIAGYRYDNGKVLRVATTESRI
jgi:hypothetical protein